MSIDRFLSSVEFNLEVHAINVKWIKRLIENGEFMGDVIERGAYPVNSDNEVDDSVKTLLGASLQDIIGESAAWSQRELEIAKAAIFSRDIELRDLQQKIAILEGQITLRAQMVTQLNDELAALKNENMLLKNSIPVAQA